MPDIRLDQDDFVIQYRDTDRNSNRDTLYPKLVQWVTESPVTFGETMQITASVLQRKYSAYEDWEFVPSLRVSSPSLSLSPETGYDTSPFLDDSTIVLMPEESFDDALFEIELKIAELERKYI